MEKQDTKVWGIIGLCVAIASIVLGWIPIFGQVFWAVGVIFCIVAFFIQKNKGLAYAGLGVSVFSLLLMIGIAKACSTVADELSKPESKLNKDLDEAVQKSLDDLERKYSTDADFSTSSDSDDENIIVSEDE